MEYIKEEQILHYKELCAEPITEVTEDLRLLRLFRENVRLVHYILDKSPCPRDAAIDKEDLLQEGYLGLWQACIKYDESQGFEFSTLAVPYIKGRILRALRDIEPVKTSRAHKDMRSLLIKYNLTLPLTEEEISLLLENSSLSRKQIERFMELSILSFDTPIQGTDDAYLADIVPSTYTTECELSDDEIESIVDHILEYIKPNNRDIVEEWMYATLAGVSLRNQDLANKYSMSQPNISRILNAAIEVVKMNGDKVRELFGL